MILVCYSIHFYKVIQNLGYFEEYIEKFKRQIMNSPWIQKSVLIQLLTAELAPLPYLEFHNNSERHLA